MNKWKAIMTVLLLLGSCTLLSSHADACAPDNETRACSREALKRIIAHREEAAKDLEHHRQSLAYLENIEAPAAQRPVINELLKLERELVRQHEEIVRQFDESIAHFKKLAGEKESAPKE